MKAPRKHRAIPSWQNSPTSKATEQQKGMARYPSDNVFWSRVEDVVEISVGRQGEIDSPSRHFQLQELRPVRPSDTSIATLSMDT